MNLIEIAGQLEIECLTPELVPDPARQIGGGYASDLLSDVLAHAPRDGILVTVQVHMNVVAVSVHAGLAAVIFAMGRKPDEVVRSRAAAEGIALFCSEETAFDIAGKLYSLGLRGTRV